MIREVFIDGVQMDVNENSQTGYIFNSPVFRDISAVLSNRTTTYKLPKTDNNLKNIGLANNPEVDSEYPYREHTILEYRDGLPFIKGICALLASSDTDLEFSVIWGNTINLLSLTDINLRELKGEQYVDWNENSSFLLASDTENKYGFVAADYGKGLTDFRYIHPSITLQGVLDIIEESQNVKFKYPDRLTDVFNKTWIPLLERNANPITWQDTNSVGVSNGYYSNSMVRFKVEKNELGIINDRGLFTMKAGDVSIIITGFVSVPGNYSNYTLEIQIGCAYPLSSWYSNVSTIHKIEMIYDSVTNESTSKYVDITESAYFEDDEYTQTGVETWIYVQLRNNSEPHNTFLPPSEKILLTVNIPYKPAKVPFGYKFPIIPNLPDMKVVEFLKVLMQMYGLWIYHRYREDDVLEFLSIDDLYKLKEDSYDWSNKLVNTTRGQFNLSYLYGDYLQNNTFKYKNDKDVTINADGAIIIDNETIPDREKELVKIDFSPSYSGSDANGNVYARLELFDTDGEEQSIGNRILSESEKFYKLNNINYKTALFDKSLYFGGDEGLVNTYYGSFQHILRHPVVAECYVYLSDVELHQYKEAYPVYINGVYYMPITVTVQTDGLAVCNLIKMPYRKEKSPS